MEEAMTIRVTLRCGCGRLIETKDFPDDKGAFIYVERIGECRECSEGDGHWQHSTEWKEPKPKDVLKDTPEPRRRLK